MQFLPGDLAQLQADDEANRRRQAQAQALQQAGFNPVQGGNPLLSLLTSFASTFAGNKLMKDSDTKASELLAKQFEMENQQSQAKMEAEQRRRDEDYQRELEKLTKAEEAKAKFRAPRNIDPLSPEGIAASLGLERAKMGMQPKGAGPAPPAWQKQLDAAKQMGIDLSPEDLKQLVTGLKPEAAPKPPTVGAEARNKLALINNAIANAKKYQERTVSGEDFNDIAARTNDTPQLIKSAIQDMLYAKSGASAPVEEVKKAEDMFGPGIFEKDATAASKVANLIQDLSRMRDEISGQPATPQAPPQQGGPAPGTIQAGYRFKGGNPADPNSWEPVG